MRKTGLRKCLGMMLIAVLAGSLVTACGKSGDEGKETDTGTSADAGTMEEVVFPLKESPKISMLAPTFGSFTFENTRAWQYLDEKCNVDWEIQELDPSAIAEKKNLLLSTNQYPDVFYKCNFTQTEIDEQAELGTIIPLDDLIKKYAPNFQKLLDENPIINERVRSEDGHIYSFPMLVEADAQITCTWINTKWLDNLGLEKPTNPDELYDVLKAFKEQDANGNGDPNDEIPFTSVSGTTFNNFMPYFGLTVDRATNTSVVDDQLVFVPTTEEYKEMTRFMAKLYQDGLVDKNIFSQSTDQLKAQAFGNDNYGMLLLGRAQLITDDAVSMQYDALDPFEGGNVYLGSGVTPGTLVITDTCEHPEIVVAWADYFYTEEGGALVWVGIEGETYEIDSDGNYVDLMKDKDPGSIQKVLLAGVPTPSLRPEELRNKALPEWEKKFQSERTRIGDLAEEVFPMLYLDKDQTKDVASISATITPYVNEYFAKVVVGEYDLDSTWDEYVNNLKNMELDQYMSIYNDAYNASKEK